MQARTVKSSFLSSYWLLLVVSGLLLLLCYPEGSLSIILCDGDCADNTQLDVCMKDDQSKTPLYLMGFFPCDVTDFRGRGLTVAAQMAIRAVLRDTSILPNYSLRLSFDNTKCQRRAAVRAFIRQLVDRNLTRHMIIGPGCSTGAVRIAETAQFWNLTQISYTATTITLSDKRRFPTFVRTISSDNASIEIVSALVKEYEWEQVAIITETNEVFSNLTPAMTGALEDAGVKVLTERLSFRSGGQENPINVVQQLNISGARVVVLNVFEGSAREILCLAHKRGMFYPRYVFISYYWFSDFWWTDPILKTSSHTYDPVNCTKLELTEAVFRSLSVDYYPMPAPGEEDVPTDVGYASPNRFWEEFVSNLTALNYSRSEALRQAGHTYDAVWAAALALHSASVQLESGVLGKRLTLSDYDYSRGDINNVILWAARGLKFRGVSGKVSFNEFADREPTRQVFQFTFEGEIDVEQEFSTTQKPFSVLDMETGRLKYVNGESLSTVFPDGVPIVAEEVLIHPALFAVYTTVSCVGILFAIGCLLFNLIMRKKQIVKLSSPYLNVVIIIGAIFFYVDVILFGVDENIASFTTADVLCQTRIWVATVGFSLFFGTVLAKTWRVYYIFHNVKLKKKPMKDWVLFLIVSAFVALDVVFLVIVTVDLWRLRLQRKLLDSNKDGNLPVVVDVCTSDAADYWLPVLLVYKALYLLVGIMLAVQTYKVKIKELRDFKLIVASVMGISIISVVLTLIGFLVRTQPDISYILLGFFIMSLITGVLVLLFATRMVELYRNPSGEVNLSTVPQASSGGNRKNEIIITTNDSGASSEDNAKIAKLRATIESLKTQIKAAKKGDMVTTDADGSSAQLLSSADAIDPADVDVREASETELSTFSSSRNEEKTGIESDV